LAYDGSRKEMGGSWSISSSLNEKKLFGGDNTFPNKEKGKCEAYNKKN
jgi:hypothetical protein